MDNEIEKMIGYVNILSEVDTSGVEPMVQPMVYENVLREDVVTSGNEREELMVNAPQVEGDYFRVPRSI